MGLLGSAFGRALAGGGAAAANISSKYIDEELQVQRQQAFADIQRANANNMRGDQLAFDTDPANVQARAGAARTTALAAGDTADEVQTRRLGNTGLNEATRGKAAGDAQAAQDIELGRLTNQPLNEAARVKSAGDADAATTAKIEAMHRMATDPKATEAQRAEAAIKLEALQGEVKARTAGAIEVVNATEKARHDAGAYERTGAGAKPPPHIKAELDALDKRDEQANAAIVKAQAEGMWDPAKNPSQKQLQTALSANRMRRSQLMAPYLETGGGKADPLGMRSGGAGSTATDNTGEATTANQGARDVEAGKLMIRSEFGGDIDKARQALAQIVAESAGLQGERRTVMQGEAARLKKGIDAWEGGGAAKGPRLMDRAQSKRSADKPQGVEGYDDRTLARLAAIDGHADQARAKAELARRKGAAPTADAPEDAMLGLGA